MPTQLRRRWSTGSSLLLAVVGLFALLEACGGGAGSRRERAPGAALWLSTESEGLDADGMRRLRDVGAQELFVDAGRVDLAGGSVRIERSDWPQLPPGAAVTLALHGAAPAPGSDFEASARALVAEVETLRRDAESAQLLPLGVHLELTGLNDEDHDKALGEWLENLAETLDPGLFLSVGLERNAIARDTALAAARRADFAVAWLYGQGIDDRDDPAAWDPQRVLADIDRLEAAKVDFLLGLHTVARFELRSREGATRGKTTRGGLGAFATRPELERLGDDLFGGAGRILYTFKARRPAEVLGLAATTGEQFRVVRTAPGIVQNLIKLVTSRNPRHFLGPVVERLAGPQEKLALSVDDVVTALGNAPGGPRLTPRIVVKSHRSDTWVFELLLANESRQGTDLASTEWNFLQLRVGGAYISRVQPGDFNRYRFWLNDQEVRPGVGSWREPDEVKLYTPLVEGGETLSAEVEVRTRSSAPELTIGGSFLLPEGRILELEPWTASFSELPSR